MGGVLELFLFELPGVYRTFPIQYKGRVLLFHSMPPLFLSLRRIKMWIIENLQFKWHSLYFDVPLKRIIDYLPLK